MNEHLSDFSRATLLPEEIPLNARERIARGGPWSPVGILKLTWHIIIGELGPPRTWASETWSGFSSVFRAALTTPPRVKLQRMINIIVGFIIYYALVPKAPWLVHVFGGFNTVYLDGVWPK